MKLRSVAIVRNKSQRRRKQGHVFDKFYQNGFQGESLNHIVETADTTNGTGKAISFPLCSNATQHSFMAKFEGIVTKVQSVGTGYDWITFKFLTPPGFQGGITLFKLTEAIALLLPPLSLREQLWPRDANL